MGIAGTVLRHGRGGDFNDVCTVVDGEPMPRFTGTGPDCRGQYDGVKSAERMMWIGYAGAGAFTAAGVTLLLLSRSPAARRVGQPLCADPWHDRCRVRVDLLTSATRERREGQCRPRKQASIKNWQYVIIRPAKTPMPMSLAPNSTAS